LSTVGQRIRRVVVEGDIHTIHSESASGVGPDDRVLPGRSDEQKVEIVRGRVEE